MNSCGEEDAPPLAVSNKDSTRQSWEGGVERFGALRNPKDAKPLGLVTDNNTAQSTSRSNDNEESIDNVCKDKAAMSSRFTIFHCQPLSIWSIYPQKLRESLPRKSDLSWVAISELCHVNDVARVIVSESCLPWASLTPKIYLCDAITGRPIWHPNNTRPYEGAVDCRDNRISKAADILILESYADVLQPDVVLLVEIFASGLVAKGTVSQPLAWAFLRPRGRQGQVHVGHRRSSHDDGIGKNKLDEEGGDCFRTCKLQMFKHRRNTWLVKQEARRRRSLQPLPSSMPPPVFLQYLRMRRKPYLGAIRVAIGPVPTPSEPCNPLDCSESRNDTLAPSLTNEGENDNNTMRLRRGPADSCLPPTQVEHCLKLGNCLAHLVQFCTSGTMLAVAVEISNNSTSSILFFDTKTFTVLHEIAPAHHGLINEITWSRDDALLISASNDGSAKVWRCSPKTMEPTEHEGKRTSPCFQATSWHLASSFFLASAINSAAFLSKSNIDTFPLMAVTGASDCSLRLWDRKTQQDLGFIGGIIIHQGCVSAIAIESRRIFSGDSTGCILLWMPNEKDIMSGQSFKVIRRIDCLKGLRGREITCLKLNPVRQEGKSQLLIKHENGLCIFDSMSQRISNVLHSSSVMSKQTTGGKSAVFSPDGQYVLATLGNEGVGLWDGSSGQKEMNNVSFYPILTFSHF